ncbi:MAG: glucose-6-phosphate dehydrogenase [Pyrinomonadaceae bacterium]
MATNSKAEPCVMVIFGATGDLTKRKLLPAIYNLAKDGYLPDKFAIIGVGRQELERDEFRNEALGHLKEFAGNSLDKETVRWLRDRLYYTGGDFGEDKQLFSDLKELLGELCTKRGIPPNYFYYMALPPNLFAEVAGKVVNNGMGREEHGHWRRFIFEKPFGHDLRSAKKLNADLLKILKERQIYRIDHYLGKETVQNLLVFRFGNGMFEPIWNRNFVDHVQITVGETLGVEQRGKYYDAAGALRDMVPNHIFQLVTLTAMEPPVSFNANEVRDEQAKVLEAITPFDKKSVETDVIRGQYIKGVEDGKRVVGYRDEQDISRRSTTETSVTLKLSIDNWRWADVPFYLRTGKRLAEKHTSIIVQFKQPPFMLFRGTPVDRLRSNYIDIHIQPDEGITLHFGAKVPGPEMKLGAVDMDFNYVEHFGERISTGYERLLFDCMMGDATLFQRADMVEAGWQIVSPILKHWNENRTSVPRYAAGSWGPKASDELLERDGRKWRNPDHRSK